MENAKQAFGAEQEPWVDVQRFLDFCDEHHVEVKQGERHNRTDGEVHYCLRFDGLFVDSRYDFVANRWSIENPAWQRVYQWIAAKPTRVKRWAED